MTDTLPRAAFVEYETRAWLYDNEARMLDALTSGDLTYSAEITVLLAEDNDGHGRRKKGRAHAWNDTRTDEQEAREKAASDLLPDLGNALYSGARMLSKIAACRRELYYVRRGESVPEVPAGVEP